MSSPETKDRKRKHKMKLKKITFETEFVTKDIAEQTLHENESHEVLNTPIKKSKLTELKTRGSSNNKILTESKERKTEKVIDNIPETKVLIKANISDESVENTKEELDVVKPETKKGNSKRAQKRKKQEQLIMAKKLKADYEMQEKCLNYLSNWKHNRNDWKFEKLRQKWLHKNIFDTEKIPDRLWNTLLEYFENSQGNIKKKVIEEADKFIKLYEKGNELAKGDTCETLSIMSKRARDILQYLQTAEPRNARMTTAD